MCEFAAACGRWSGNSGSGERTRIANLIARGIPRAFAVPVGASRKGPWRMSQVKWVVFAVPGRYFESLGLVIPWTSHA